MKSQTKAVVVGSMTAFIGILSPATVFATGNDHDKDRKDSTCYAVEVEGPVDATNNNNDGPPLIVRYLTENEGSLSSKEEASEFGHLNQRAYSVVGKAAALFMRTGLGVWPSMPATEPNENTEPNGDPERVMTTVDGTIITGQKGPQPE